MIYDKIPCGGFWVDTSAFTIKDEQGKKILTAGGGLMTNGADGIILTSSTPDSTKQFMITVNDNGELTATAYEAPQG